MVNKEELGAGPETDYINTNEDATLRTHTMGKWGNKEQQHQMKGERMEMDESQREQGMASP